MSDDEFRVGRIFRNVDAPTRSWRISERRGDRVTLERVDKPNVNRFVSTADLRDPRQYVRQE